MKIQSHGDLLIQEHKQLTTQSFIFIDNVSPPDQYEIITYLAV